MAQQHSLSSKSNAKNKHT